MFDIFTLTEYSGAPKVSSIEEAQKLSKTRYFWILDERNDYSDFDLLQEPTPWESEQMHVWPSQHQDNGGTMLVPKLKYTDTNYAHRIVKRNVPYSITYLDRNNIGTENSLSWLAGTYRATPARFINDYLGTLKRIVNKCNDTDTHIWVISSLCNYVGFDLTWHPSEWQGEMLHVFPSNEQKFGDTFLINVKHFKEQTKHLELLEWYDTICFHENNPVLRIHPPIYLHTHDNHVDAVKSAIFQKIADPEEFIDPVTLFSTTLGGTEKAIPTLNLWRPETRTIMPLDKGATRVLIPRDALTEVRTQLYDYKYIDKSHNDDHPNSPIDIVFLSNGEKCAKEHFDWLKQLTTTSNNVFLVDRVQGRLNAYRECARKSTTDWFFVVYAKLKVDKNFNWNWQPDRMQAGKHYIFQAYNAITGDTYGHMAMIAFNKRLVLEHDGKGLDFSLHQEHEIIPILSGEAIYASEPWAAWRTAFREVIKLQVNNGAEALNHLTKWIGAEDEWTACGVADAVEYFNRNHNDTDKLLLSYEWDFLLDLYKYKYETTKKIS